MLRLNSLRAAASLNDVAALLQLKPAKLAYILYRLPASQKYKSFQISKRNGGTRTIEAPVESLKVVQRRLSTLLQDCLADVNKAKGRKDRAAHGFYRGRSIITNAHEHRNRRYVFNVDLEDFFPSINFGRVRGFFIRDKSFCLQERVATVIAQIACNQNALPQGSPCSPVISNLIAHVMDMHLVRLAGGAGCMYTRYADDLTFSTSDKIFPIQIAASPDTDMHRWVPSPQLREIIKHCGFRLNSAKTHMQYKDSRQEVTGLVVNRRINVRYDYRHNVRAMVHNLLQTGSFKVQGGQDGTLNQLHGMLGFIDEIDFESERSRLAKTKLPKELIYQRFLIYKNFFVADRPVILCEGETDNVYLTHAVHRLAPDYPQLAGQDANGKTCLLVRLYKYRKSSTARILGLGDGGTASLSNFIRTYKRQTDKFKIPGGKQPLIILFDNDSGSHPIFSAVKTLGKAIRDADGFCHLFRNLYVVPTPKSAGAHESKIEDFFDSAIKATVVNGKLFDAANDFDPTTHYGKKIFAYKVVRPNATSINFNGFRPLLDNLVLAIKDHQGNCTVP